MRAYFNSRYLPVLSEQLDRMAVFFSNEYKVILISIFLLGLIYLILPGPKKIDDFPPLIPSLKSNLEGDTIQNPNIAAYFSDFRRDHITAFYQKKFVDLHWLGNIFPLIKLNHPPEYAYQYIRDQQESTFLEEYTYPLRESFFVNGYEPLIENRINKKPSNFAGNHIVYRDSNFGPELFFNSKTTIRFYPNSVFSRILIYLGIWVASLALYQLGVIAIKE